MHSLFLLGFFRIGGEDFLSWAGSPALFIISISPLLLRVRLRLKYSGRDVRVAPRAAFLKARHQVLNEFSRSLRYPHDGSKNSQPV
jgi:hypothetical protein